MIQILDIFIKNFTNFMETLINLSIHNLNKKYKYFKIFFSQYSSNNIGIEGAIGLGNGLHDLLQLRKLRLIIER